MKFGRAPATNTIDLLDKRFTFWIVLKLRYMLSPLRG
jgi:hypothetical protein